MTTENENVNINSARNQSDLANSQRDNPWKKQVKLNPPHAVIFKEVGDEGKSTS